MIAITNGSYRKKKNIHNNLNTLDKRIVEPFLTAFYQERGFLDSDAKSSHLKLSKKIRIFFLSKQESTGPECKVRAAVPVKTPAVDGLIGKIANKGRPNTL